MRSDLNDTPRKHMHAPSVVMNQFETMNKRMDNQGAVKYVYTINLILMIPQS